jgi:hypothetical protein
VKKTVFGLLLLSLGAGAETREQLMKKFEANWQRLHNPKLTYTARLTQDAGWEKGEGTWYVQFPQRYHFDWDNNSDAIYDGSLVRIYSGGGNETEQIKLEECPIYMLLKGIPGKTVRVASIVKEANPNGAGQVMAVDLQPKGEGHGSGQLRVYFSDDKEGQLLGWREPAVRRSGYGPDWIYTWVRDLHPETPDAKAFKPPQKD